MMKTPDETEFRFNPNQGSVKTYSRDSLKKKNGGKTNCDNNFLEVSNHSNLSLKEFNGNSFSERISNQIDKGFKNTLNLAEEKSCKENNFIIFESMSCMVEMESGSSSNNGIDVAKQSLRAKISEQSNPESDKDASIVISETKIVSPSGLSNEDVEVCETLSENISNFYPNKSGSINSINLVATSSLKNSSSCDTNSSTEDSQNQEKSNELSEKIDSCTDSHCDDKAKKLSNDKLDNSSSIEDEESKVNSSTHKGGNEKLCKGNGGVESNSILRAVDENSSEPAEKTKFFNIEQDSVADDGERGDNTSQEETEDPFSQGKELTGEASSRQESGSTSKIPQELEESSSNSEKEDNNAKTVDNAPVDAEKPNVQDQVEDDSENQSISKSAVESMEVDNCEETSENSRLSEHEEKEKAATSDKEKEDVNDNDEHEEKTSENNVEKEPLTISIEDESEVGNKSNDISEKSKDSENVCIVPDLTDTVAISTVDTVDTVDVEHITGDTDTSQSTSSKRPADDVIQKPESRIKLRKLLTNSEVESTEVARLGKDAVKPVDKSVNSLNFVRRCALCQKELVKSEMCLYWETMEFCNEECLGAYQSKLGAHCANCKGAVQSSSLGKYCVRFGTDINQFCCSNCLEEFKKGLKVCSYCQKDVSSGAEGFLAPVGDKGQFKDFCSQKCMVLYEAISNNIAEVPETQVCTVCNVENIVKVKILVDDKETKLCSEVCFAAYKFANSIECDKCNMCRKYYYGDCGTNYVIYYEDELHTFCSKTCMNVYILGKRKIILCGWCKVKKYNFDMIKKVLNNGTSIQVCSLNCLGLFQISKNLPNTQVTCDNCGRTSPAQYYLSMSDSSIRSFCTYICVMSFQGKFGKPAAHIGTAAFPTGGPKRISPKKSEASASLPVISTVTSLAQVNGPNVNSQLALPSGKTGVVQQIIVRPPLPKSVCNKIIQTKPSYSTKGVSCKPFSCSKETQTEVSGVDVKSALIPIPVPIYVPLPMAMYKLPVPYALPIPLPVPVPIFIPTTRNSAEGIMKEIKKIHAKIPTDPYEAELLMMAEMVAGEKKIDKESCDSNSGTSTTDPSPAAVVDENESSNDSCNETPPAVSSDKENATDSESKKTPDLEKPPDLEDSLQSARITANDKSPETSDTEPEVIVTPSTRRTRKRLTRSVLPETPIAKRLRKKSESPSKISPPSSQSPSQEVEKPDANMNLKYTLGVNAWRHWVVYKNATLADAAATNNRKPVLFKTDLLQLTSEELNYSLCLFVKEVKKPDGSDYAPDTIYYICLGIQQYFCENGRAENIFTDPFYEPFTDCLDDIAKKFSQLYDNTHYIVTRVTEEHLWESKQLGAYSPHVLLNTLMFFNTKNFNLGTVEEHMQLSFSQVMKHWKRSSSSPNTSGSKPHSNRNVILRFYPPQTSSNDASSKKKKVYEQEVNEVNPLRCPVKLYEFYLSKCPESVKTRNDVFYLLPERSCVPDSPVWYSTMALDEKPLVKMLRRIKMVKEINIALLTT